MMHYDFARQDDEAEGNEVNRDLWYFHDVFAGLHESYCCERTRSYIQVHGQILHWLLALSNDHQRY